MGKDYTIFTKKRLVDLKEAYEKCEELTFTFDGQEFDKNYAKYLIQHLEHEFGITKDGNNKNTRGG